VLASFRSALPAVPGRGGGVLWLLAGALGGGLLARHALVSLMGAWVDFAADAAMVPGLGQGDLLVLAALVVPSLVLAFASRLRSPRPALLVPALVGLIPLVVVLAPALSRGLPTHSTRLDLPGGVAALLAPASLLWATTLPGPAALPLSRRRPLLHHWLPRLLAAAVLVGLPAVLLGLGGKSLRAPGELVALAAPARRVFGPYGAEVGAGLECLVTLVALHVLLVLCARVAARSLPRLRSGVFPGLAMAAGLVAAWMPPSPLVLGAAVAGWTAVLWGIEPDGVAPPPLLEGPQ
jgi:hypothetical protein